MERTDTVAGGGGAHHRVLNTYARIQASDPPPERTELRPIAAPIDSTARGLLWNGVDPPPQTASAQVNARAVERTACIAVEDRRAGGHAITAGGMAVTAAPIPPTKRKRGRPRGSKNKPKPTKVANQPKRRRSAATPQRSLDDAMIQVSTPSVPERAVEGSNAAFRSQQTGLLAVSQRSDIHVTTTLAASVGATAAAANADPEPEISSQQQAPTTRSPIRPPLIPDLYIDTLVAFSPAKEGWTTRKKHKYVGVGNAYLVGRVCRIMKRTLFQIQWLDSQYQNHIESLNLSMIQRGNANYRSLHGSATAVVWRNLCAMDEGEIIDIEDDVAALEECMEEFNPPNDFPTSLAEVEAINSMRFDPTAQCEEPADLFQHADGSTTTRLRPEFKHLFEHSASASFFAYIPVSFWQQVVGETNSYARVHGIKLKTPFSLEEIMKFIGVLLYMSLVDKGEYSNYWGQQVEDAIFGGNAVNLDSVMPLRRFKKLRQALSFQCVEENATNTDQAARIRPLLNLLKSTGSKYVEVGRNVALDEASIACRSKYGKPLIVYNPMKPGGKYHFRIYMLCCSTTWISLNFRLHCQSNMADRLDGVTTPVEAQALSDELASSSSIRKCVLEVVRPLYGTRRIINSDNYYTSVQLLDALRLKGLYARGTVRKTSAHFPRHVVLEKNDGPRGTSRQGVSVDRNTVAASWYDSSIVTVVSNADASTQTTVTRQVRSEKVTFSAPTCIKEYNKNMQGVDRLDQTRGRFSLSDGHSFKKWYKKLGFALIDVARANAYFTRKLALNSDDERDSHKTFVAQLSSELISGKWKEAPSERRMFYTDGGGVEHVTEVMSPSSAVWVAQSHVSESNAGSPQKRCSAVASKQMYSEKHRKRRQCVVCRWEDRYATEVTDFCVLHGVCLCQHVSVTTKPFTCVNPTWTCWEKYHRFYLPRKLFSAKGKVRTSCELYKMKLQAQANQDADTNTAPLEGSDDSGARPSVARMIAL